MFGPSFIEDHLRTDSYQNIPLEVWKQGKVQPPFSSNFVCAEYIN